LPPTITFLVYNEHQIIRTAQINGVVWFVAIEVARILGYRDATNMIRDLHERERLNLTLNENSPDNMRAIRAEVVSTRDTTLINISGLFKVVFRSRHPEAEAFTDWVTRTLLPALLLPEHALSAPKMRVAFRAYVLDIDREHRDAGIDRVPERWFGQEFPGVVIRRFPEWIRALVAEAGHREYHVWKKQETKRPKLKSGDDPRQIEFFFTVGRGKRERTIEAANATTEEVRLIQRHETQRRLGMQKSLESLRRRAKWLYDRFNAIHDTPITPAEIAELSPDLPAAVAEPENPNSES
jgi:hypothetical protein